jgi:hypothetical protein
VVKIGKSLESLSKRSPIAPRLPKLPNEMRKHDLLSKQSDFRKSIVAVHYVESLGESDIAQRVSN